MRSRLKCDIISLSNGGKGFMKTKIIYISGTEVFDIADIRAAFDEVRLALNLDKNTVLFGVPVDNDDAGLTTNIETTETKPIETIEEPTIIPEEIQPTPVISEIEPSEEPITPKKRGRPRKEIIETVIEEPEENIVEEQIEEEPEEVIEEIEEEKIIPILSVLSSDDESNEEEVIEENKEITDETEPVEETVEETSEETSEEITEEKTEEEIIDDIISENISNVPDTFDEETEPDLEKLLSGIKPLGEDTSAKAPIAKEETNETENVDATLEQLATEYVKNQDKIASESKTASRSKISTLRSILPFKPKTQKDSNSGDLFSWGGIAANDEDFSVPGFFTKKSK
jgi:hypothetical protein